jgi:acyl carrier protein
MSDKNEIRRSLKEHIIRELNLEDILPEDIDDDASLFADGLGLDSIDALELVVILEKYYDIKIRDEETGRQVLRSINTMVEHIVQSK